MLDLTIALQHPILLVLLFMASIAAIFFESRLLRNRRNDPVEDHQPDYLTGTITAAYALTFLSSDGAIWRSADSYPWSAYLGVALLWVGLSIRAAAIMTLKSSFSPRLEVTTSQSLVTAGPYAYSRHPGYIGAYIMLAGWAVSLGNSWSLCALLALLPALKLRVDREERILSDHYGPKYSAYASNVRLLPWLNRHEKGPTKLARRR